MSHLNPVIEPDLLFEAHTTILKCSISLFCDINSLMPSTETEC